jgi:hypothetical protein
MAPACGSVHADACNGGNHHSAAVATAGPAVGARDRRRRLEVEYGVVGRPLGELAELEADDFGEQQHPGGGGEKRQRRVGARPSPRLSKAASVWPPRTT